MRHNSSTIPPDLKHLPQWLGFKDTKAPRVPFGTYHLASYTNPDAHSDYETALAAVANDHLDGVGIAVTEFDPFVVVDLDGCIDDDGDLTEFAQEIVDDLDTYTEVSNSGKGLHLVCRSYVDGNYKANDDERAADRAIEFFATAGFVILTGHVHGKRTKIANVPRSKLRRMVDELRMSRKQRRTYDRTDPPDYTDLPGDHFENMSALGAFASLVTTGELDPAMADRFPRDRDGDIDRSKVLFLAAINLRDAGMTAAEAYTLLDNHSQWVAEFMAEKADGWLWHYVIEPAYKSIDGEVPSDTLASTRDAEFITQADLVASLQPVDWLIDGVLEARAVGLLAGKHSSYKSTVAIDWVHSVASGRAWLGRSVRRGAAVVIAGEGARGLARRAHAWGVEHNLTGQDLADLPVLWSKSAVQIMDAERMAKAVATIHETLAERYGVEYPDLVIVDTLNKNFAGGDENSASDISLFFEKLTRAFPHSCVVIVHHFGKDKNRGSRGSSAIDASLDFLYHAEAVGGEVVLRSQKMKDADKPAAMYLRPEVIKLQIEGEEETTGVTIGVEFRANAVADALGRMKPELQVAATRAIAVLGNLESSSDFTVTRKVWVTAMLDDEVAAEDWNIDDRNGWRTLLNRLVASLIKAELVGSVTEDDGETPPTTHYHVVQQ